MTARDTIARACFDPGHFVGLRQKNETLDQWRARAVEAALTAAGHRIVGPADMEAVGEAEAFSAWWEGSGRAAQYDHIAQQAAYAAWCAASAHMPVPASFVPVPEAALKWLDGSGPDENGHWFGDAPNDNGRGAFWWRSKFADMLASRPKGGA